MTMPEPQALPVKPPTTATANVSTTLNCPTPLICRPVPPPGPALLNRSGTMVADITSGAIWFRHGRLFGESCKPRFQVAS